MRIAGLHLHNWLIFAGKHDLRLDAKPYALVARHDLDEDRSNGCGKTALVEIIGYVLFGRHRKRTEDEVISIGEKSCEGRIEFDDGSVASRSRKVGKSTVLTYVVDGRELRGAEAQAEIIRRVGLDEQDFYVTCSLEQRQAAQFVLARPEDRLKIVSGWFGLEALEQAEADARGRAAVLIGERDKIASAIEARRLVERDSLGYDGDSLDAASLQALRDALVAEIARVEGEVAAARSVLADRRAERSAAEALVRGFEDARRLATLTVEGKALAARVKALDEQVAALDADEIEAASARASADNVAAKKEVERRRIVAQGRFDGRCPVAELTCPARQQINEGRDAAKVAYDAAVAASRSAAAEASEYGQIAQHLRSLQLSQREATTELEAARKVARSLQASARSVEGAEEPDARALAAAEVEANDVVVRLERELAALRHRLQSADRARRERQDLVEQQDAIDLRLATAREGTRIFGKEGAQRVLAESALQQVEGLANQMLVEAGTDLSVTVRWSREGSGLAKACAQCAWPFPASAKVKECSRCRTPRGPNLINSLELLLSWRSGAAEDLAGIAVQLAASSWLRKARGSAWSTAILDEPASQLDATHRRGFVAGVNGMLSAAGFTQFFFVAHHASMTDALPGRILIASDGTRSRVEVVA